MIHLIGTIEKISTKLKSDTEYLVLTVQTPADDIDPEDLSQLIERLHTRMTIILQGREEQLRLGERVEEDGEE